MAQDTDEVLDAPPKKKVKILSVKELRNKLATTDNVLALQQFLHLCKNTEDHDYAFEYLENGGSCLELFQLLEVSLNVPATLVMEIVHHILLGIVSQYPQHYTPAYEACRYFLNTHLALINKMLTLSSSSIERKIVLKLLTSFVTLSRNLAKDVLVNVNFNPTNLEVLTKQTDDKDSVRNALVNFLVAYLVEDHYPTISLLLEKKGLLTSIINGLQYDSADTVCMVMLSLTNNILENKLVSKTTKMNVFSTPVVKDIVNLYNWKGPRSFSSKKKHQNVVVDEVEKSRVSESVHKFLLVLCTSHTFGVIFKDRQLGLGKTHNSLMLTVLDSLEKPWEHSYASDLVTKICGACPDLAKVLWNNLKQFLEPRDTGQWYKAILFVGQLTKELKPSSIEYGIHDISVLQLAQVIQTLVAPASVLKVIVPENFTFEKPELKCYVLTSLLEIYQALQNYLVAAQKWLKPDNLRILKNLQNEHILRTFPNAQNLLQDWSQSDIKLILELLDLYQSTNPQLLESLSTINLVTFLDKIKDLSDVQNATALQIQAIKVFVNFEPALFSPQNEFGVVVPLILMFYYETKNQNAFMTLKLLFKNTGIFEGCIDEIDLWINSIFDLNSLEENTCSIIVEAIRTTSDNIFDYLNKMSEVKRECFHDDLNQQQDNFEDILEILSTDDLEDEQQFLTKSHSLSPLTLGCFEYLTKIEQSRNFKHYITSVLVNLLHSQPTPSLLTNIIVKYTTLVPDFLINYITEAPVILRKSKMRFAQNFSVMFFEDNVDKYFVQYGNEMQQYPGHLEMCLNQALFYFANLNLDVVSDLHAGNCFEVVKFVMQQNLNDLNILSKIFTHPVLLQRFSPGRSGVPTLFLTNIVKEFNPVTFLKPFRSKLADYLKRVIKKPGKKVKYVKVLELLEVLKLEIQGCCDVLKMCAIWQPSNSDLDFLSFIYQIIIFCLHDLNDVTLDDDTLTAIVTFLTFLNRLNNFDSSNLANALKTYLQNFPHYLDNINDDLFQSILSKTEYCKENSLLASFLLGQKHDFLRTVEQKLPDIVIHKGLILGLLESAASFNANNEFFENVYNNFKPSLLKALQKPQKAGQNFERYKDVVDLLLSKFMEPDAITGKVQRFEVAEPFHIQMLCALFTKMIKAESVTDVQVNNSLLTIIQITNNLFKRKTDDKILEVIKTTNIYFKLIKQINDKRKQSFRDLCENEAFQLYCKFCLKFGLSGDVSLITTVRYISQFVDFDEREAQLILDMASSHSEFLELLLGENTDGKVELLELILVLCERWPSLMQRNHIPVFLAAYRATLKPSDRTILILLQMYEKTANKTNFYDFKPFLWGSAAATHYSVRTNIQTALWRQPKMGDILDILHENIVINTIVNYPLSLQLQGTKIDSPLKFDVYDLSFFLPLFSSLLSPENEVAVYKFPKSGALSLTVVALASNNKEVRLAACHVLSRWHFHVESRQGGRNRPLWLRYIEALCRGTAVLKNFKLNNFSAIFWAKMGLILTQPYLSLYIPLTYYLGAKVTPNLDTIPELYTFLHSSNVNYREMRLFILEIIRDGLRTDDDFSVALHSMAFKLIMELYSSCVTNEDIDTRSLILSIMQKATSLAVGKKLLVSSYGLLPWLFNVTCNLSNTITYQKLLHYIIKILCDIKSMHISQTVLIVSYILDKELVRILNQDDLAQFLHLILFMYDNCSLYILDQKHLQILISCTNNSKRCDYLLKYGCKYVVPNSSSLEVDNLIETLVIKWMNK